MIAVSPLALVDMAFIAWHNLRLINRIATLYGIELGYYSRLRLFKLVLLNIAFAEPANWCAKWGWTGCRKICCSFVYPRSSGDWCRTSDGTTGD